MKEMLYSTKIAPEVLKLYRLEQARTNYMIKYLLMIPVRLMGGVMTNRTNTLTVNEEG